MMLVKIVHITKAMNVMPLNLQTFFILQSFIISRDSISFMFLLHIVLQYIQKAIR